MKMKIKNKYFFGLGLLLLVTGTVNYSRTLNNIIFSIIIFIISVISMIIGIKLMMDNIEGSDER